MMYRRLPTTRIALFTIGIFFTAGTIAFAQTTTKPLPQKAIAQNTAPTVVTPTKKPPLTQKRKLAKAKLTNTPTPTAKPLGGVNTQITPTSIITPTAPTISILPTSAPTSIPPSTGSLLDQVNSYRSSQGLRPVQSNGETCAFAATRAQEIASNFSHDAFNSRIANNTLPYAHWTAATENIAQTSNPNNVVQMWINSPGHAANMRADTPFVCIQQHGDYYAYEGMKP